MLYKATLYLTDNYDGVESEYKQPGRIRLDQVAAYYNERIKWQGQIIECVAVMIGNDRLFIEATFKEFDAAYQAWMRGLIYRKN